MKIKDYNTQITEMEKDLKTLKDNRAKELEKLDSDIKGLHVSFSCGAVEFWTDYDDTPKLDISQVKDLRNKLTKYLDSLE